MSASLATPLQTALGDIDLAACGATKEVLVAVTELAIEIAREGRKGRRVGTIFTIGSEREVLKHSETLILDPLEGHPSPRRSVHDADLRETV